MALQTRYRTAITVGLILLFVVLRFLNFTQSCLWFDEIFSIHAAEHSWTEIFRFVALDLIHPPLFYLLLKGWISIGGEGLAWVRSLPVVFAVLSILPFWWLCRQLKLEFWARCVAIFLFAVNGAVIKYSQEVRMYSLVMCLGLYSIALFANYFINGKNFLPLVLVNVLLTYTHYFGWLIIITEVAAIIYFQRIKWRRSLLMLGICVAAFVPWILAIARAVTSGALAQNVGWIEKPNVKSLVDLAFALVEPFYARMSSIDPWSQYEISVPLLIVAALAIALFSARPKSEIDVRSIQLLSIFILLPVALVLVISWATPYSIWGTRHLIFLFPLFAILLGLAVMRAEEKWLRTICVSLIVLFSVWSFVRQARREVPHFSWCAWQPMEDQALGGSKIPIYTSEDLVAYHSWFAERNTAAGVNKLTGITGVVEDPAYFLPRGFGEISPKDIADVNDPVLLLAYRAPGFSESEAPLRNFLVKGYRIKDKNVYQAEGEVAITVLLEK